MKGITAILFITLSSILFGQINTMTFNGTSTTASGVTFSFSTGAFVSSVDGTTMSLYSSHPYATPINGGDDYKDITISQAIYIKSVNVSWATNVAGFKLQFLRTGSVVKELSSLVLGDATVNVLADKIRFYDTGVSNSGGFELANVKWDAALPVELQSFKATIHKGVVILNWETATEVNNYGFEVERSSSGEKQFEKIGFIHGHGNSNSPYEYTFTDKNPAPGEIQYRLKQMDNDGQFKYYSLASVNYSSQSEYRLRQNSPNPFNPSTLISYQIPQTGRVILKVYNVLGKVVAILVDEIKPAGQYTAVFNGNNLPSGLYIYELRTNENISSKKMMLIK